MWNQICRNRGGKLIPFDDGCTESGPLTKSKHTQVMWVPTAPYIRQQHSCHCLIRIRKLIEIHSHSENSLIQFETMTKISVFEAKQNVIAHIGGSQFRGTSIPFDLDHLRMISNFVLPKTHWNGIEFRLSFLFMPQTCVIINFIF